MQLYLCARAGVTLFDELLQRVFGEHLANWLPGRVLPLSVDPPLHQEAGDTDPLRIHQSVPAAGIREVDLLKKYHRPAKERAEALGITASRSTALRRHLRIDEDGPHSHLLELSAMKQRRYSDNAYKLMREVIDTANMNAVWNAHSPNRGPSSRNRCQLPDCAANQHKSAALTRLPGRRHHHLLGGDHQPSLAIASHLWG